MKEFLTASDIEDLVAQGVRQIPRDEKIVLTDLARERAAQLGVALVDRTTLAAPVVPDHDRQAPAAKTLPVMTSAPKPAALRSKPKGCLHSHLETGSVVPEVTCSVGPAVDVSSGSIVDQLVKAIRHLS